ncbi:MAG: hypothetical protein QY332_01605 [Anaerolineales bacterium]|nr:MAG: hypothetical protein QY332_01605 [Anaerolineales bacterium]
MSQFQEEPSSGSRPDNRSLIAAALARNIKIGANNFHWIAGLSVLNSLISAFGGGMTFIIGLGITQLTDAFAFLFAQEAPEGAMLFKGLGLVLSIVISTVFVLFGVFAGRSQRWAFVTGMLLYALDGGLLLAFQDWIGFFFHLYFLWGLWKGLQALNQLQKLMPVQAGTVSDYPQDIGMS